jgi:hypothetical protein
MNHRKLPAALLAAAAIVSPLKAEPSAPAPTLEYAFTVRATLAPPVELGEVDGKRQRYIEVTGGEVSGPRLTGTVLGGGGDWQTIGTTGLTEVYARYQLRAADGTVIGVINPGVRTATPEVIERLARGEDVDPALYYFRTTPSFTVRAGPHEWLRRHAFVARGIRRPDHVEIDFYVVN